MNPPDVRRIAWEVLCRAEQAEQYSNLALDAAIRRNGGLTDSDRALLTALVYGVTERRLTLDHWIASLTGGREIEREIRTLLRLGLYQLACLDRVPDHAAVHETVALAPRRATGFVNAVLRSFLRKNKQIDPPDRETDPVGYLSVVYSVVPELCRKLSEEFGEERCESILAAVRELPPVCLRVNSIRTTAHGLAEALRSAGYDPEPFGETGLRLRGNVPVASLPGFREGDFFVQDEASQECVRALGARPGMTVIDVCACPGSKSFGAAADMDNRGKILSFDLHASKLSLLRSGAERLGITILETGERDARTPLPEWTGKADRVICDVPCSGYGVLAKKPELRYKDPAVSVGLPEIQSAILEASSALVRPGGRLVYSTCTILPEENGAVVSSFLDRHPEFVRTGERSFFPDTDRTDGFYFAVLERQAHPEPSPTN